MKSFFEILGIPPTYSVDARELEARYHELSKKHHPDRHARADGATRVKNALATSELNQAYRALRDPVTRAEHLLALGGIEISDEKSNKVAPDFLMEVMELREQLAEARMERDHARVDALAAEVRARRDRAMADVDGGFAKGKLESVAAALVALRYYARFLDEIDRHDDARTQEELQ